MSTSLGKKPSASNQKGQALIEYMLLMITALIVLGIFYQLSSGFRDFAKAYFGSEDYPGYLNCLLTAGELPTTLGIGGPGNKDVETCAKQFQEFQLGQGKKQDFKTNPPPPSPPVKDQVQTQTQYNPSPYTPGPDNLSGPTGGGGGGSSGISENGGGSDGGSGGGGGRLAPGGAGEVSSNDLRSRSVPINDADLGLSGGSKSGKGEKVSTTKADILEQRGRGGGRKRIIPADGQTIEAQKEEDLRKGRIPASQSDINSRGRKVALLETKKGGAVQTDDSWTLGDFLKYILIAAIVIALLIFFGGQVLQYSKGQD